MLNYVIFEDTQNTQIRQLRAYGLFEEGTFSSTSDRLPIVVNIDLPIKYSTHSKKLQSYLPDSNRT